MGNKVARILIGIAILAAIFVGGWMVLPGSIKNPLLASYQEKTDDNYSTVVGAVKASTVPKNKKVTFDSMMTGVSEDSCWTIEKVAVDDAGNGSYKVYADAYKITVAFENENNDDGMVTHTNAHVRLVFDVTKDGETLKIGKKEIGEGEIAHPTQVEVGEYVYIQNDPNSNYYQESLNSLCAMGTAAE